MSITQEIKSQLARLLATEDLIVEHRSVETASFNVHDRVLTLPNTHDMRRVRLMRTAKRALDYATGVDD